MSKSGKIDKAQFPYAFSQIWNIVNCKNTNATFFGSEEVAFMFFSVWVCIFLPNGNLPNSCPDNVDEID